MSEVFEWRPMSGPLAAEQMGPHHGPRITFVHGFTQTGNSWKPMAEIFARAGYLTTVLDLPGHGGSAHVRADPRRVADMLAVVGDQGTYVGYSLGGRMCLHLAVMYPHMVHSLLLIGATPGIADADERAKRRAADDAHVERLYEVGLEQFLREWVAQPLFGGWQISDADFADRMRNTVDGLASSLQMAGTGAQGSLWPRLMELNMPVLATAGALDTKFAAIAAQIAEECPIGAFELIPGAAHAAHLQNPEATAALVERAARQALLPY